MRWLSQEAASLLSPSLSLFSGREEYGFVCKIPHSLSLQALFGSPPIYPHASLWILTCAFLYSWPNAVSRTPLFMATLEPVHRLCFPQCDSSVPLYVYQSLLPLLWRKEERRKGGSGEGRRGPILAHSLKIPTWLVRLAGGNTLSLWVKYESWYSGCLLLFI